MEQEARRAGPPSAPLSAVCGLAWTHTWSQPSTTTKYPFGSHAKAQPFPIMGERQAALPERGLYSVLTHGPHSICLRMAVKASTLPRRLMAEGAVQ